MAAERHASFSEVSAELNALHSVELGAERVLAEGETLFRDGDVGQEAFYILEGTLAVMVAAPSGPTEIARRSVGDMIGELAVVLDAPRSATVIAVAPTRVAVVSRQVITDAMHGANPLLAEMLRSLSARLREETERIKRPTGKNT